MTDETPMTHETLINPAKLDGTHKCENFLLLLEVIAHSITLRTVSNAVYVMVLM